jgi:hypothetical protein
MKTYAFITVVAVLFVTATPANASLIILGNLPQTDDNSGAVVDAGTDNVGSNFIQVREAISFTMPAQSYPLEHVVLRLLGYNTATGDVAEVGFYEDNGSDFPGTLLGSLLVSPPSASDDPAGFNFVPSTPLTLAASTKYWLMLDATAKEYDWRASSPPKSPTSQVGAIFGKQIAIVGQEPRDSSPFISSFEIVTSVPEPHGNLLLIVGILYGVSIKFEHERGPSRTARDTLP